MKLGLEKIKHVAKLANLPLTDKELELYNEQLSKILDYIDQLEKVDTSKVAPTFNTTGLKNVMSEDKVSKSLTQDQVLSNGSTDDGFFVTKGVFKNE